MTQYLTQEELEAIRKWPTPAVSNGIELFNIRPRNEGFMLSDVQSAFPEKEPMIGYAVTAVITADTSEGRRIKPQDWWEELLKIPAPRVVVIHDVDRPVVGSFWGEVNANIHKALGCVGTVTDGSVRDLDEVNEAEFQFFSSCVTVSHAYVHLVEIGVPVKVGGMTVKPGDLLLGDKHGVISIPMEIGRDVPKACQMVEDWERPVINYCKSKEFTLDGLKQIYSRPRPTWPGK
jgi:4-hydroxy-4-methyl-2-oxoglutarate aldolase